MITLMLFDNSMRRLGLKMRHLLRVWSYAAPAWLPFLVLVATIVIGFDEAGLALPWGVWGVLLPALFFGTILWVMAASTWSMRQGLAHYVGMRHALGVAMSVQLIAIMAVMLASLAPILWYAW